MKYRVTVVGRQNDFVRTLECDSIDFENSWWAKFYRRNRAHGYQEELVLVAAAPAEHLRLIELLEEK